VCGSSRPPCHRAASWCFAIARGELTSGAHRGRVPGAGDGYSWRAPVAKGRPHGFVADPGRHRRGLEAVMKRCRPNSLARPHGAMGDRRRLGGRGDRSPHAGRTGLAAPYSSTEGVSA
jgi:hypothetical protein